ncbi:hypothetical protein BKA61DRAFT_241054 [Leptodontidium sp. MPI-SDFR-AT-0119]|nr:hypothetical protein BKA61DRAFT_241054 [Leptodontidium sp. MPI-SDFR-AT-0119]
MTVVAFDPGLMHGTGLNYVLPNMLPLFRVVSGFPDIQISETSQENLTRQTVGDDVKGVSGVYFGIGYRALRMALQR